jgi:glycerophosphoryl diester phosphodiesterase
MKLRSVVIALGAVFLLAGTGPAAFGQYPKGRRILVAHRGASAYAPEHTREAYLLAIEQGADFVEQDLQITKDGVLVCLHDTTLERTTDVATVFPDRFKTVEVKGETKKVWNVADFTLAEIKRLDAGSWFDKKFAGTKVLTFQEAIDLVKGRAGIYPETKEPEFYGKLGFDMAKMLMAELKKNGLDRPGANPKTPVVIQSFSAPSLRELRKLGCRLPLVFLIDPEAPGDWISADGMKRVRKFANGLGPSKKFLDTTPDLVKWAHAAGLTVTPYTFRSKTPSRRFADVTAEMKFYFDLGIDAVFTDNPDKFPR